MKLKIWSKTLLNSYTCYEKIAEAIDKLVLSYGLDAIHLIDSQAYLFSAEQMIELTDRKKLLINLKIISDTAMSNMKPKFARILILKFVDNMKCNDISKILGISIRSYFRWLNEAINSFGLQLKMMNYTDESLKSMCSNELWIKQLYNKYLIAELSNKPKKEENEDIFDILGLALNSFRKSKNVAYSSI